MIQPYFKPDMNPNMPAFVTFYNGYFQERSKMNMQMMDLMLKQASPEYLTNMIDRTQKNIEELQKTREKIIQSSQKDKMDLIKLQTRMQLEVNKANASVDRKSLETIQKAISGGGRGGQVRFDPNKAETERSLIGTIKDQYRSEMLSTQHANHTAFLEKMKLRPEDTPDPHKVALALEVFDENKSAIDSTMPPGFSVGVKQILDRQMTGDRNTILANKYPNARGGSASTTVSIPSKDRADELGFNLTEIDNEFADIYITKKDGNLTIKQRPKDFPVSYGALPKDQKEVIQKRLKQRILQEKKGYVGAPKVKMPDDLQSTLDYIDEQLAAESDKLQGYLTRYDIGQQDILERVYAPFESNYRTENLFKRKSPEVLRQEEEIRELQYKYRGDTPSGYDYIKYNTEYQGPSGLNFGITKVNEEDIPYIFEGDKPYEINKTNPSYPFILDLLKEQDRKLGAQ